MNKNLDININKEVEKIISELGEDKIRAIGNLSFPNYEGGEEPK